jgi:hypothetical protein
MPALKPASLTAFRSLHRHPAFMVFGLEWIFSETEFI